MPGVFDSCLSFYGKLKLKTVINVQKMLGGLNTQTASSDRACRAEIYLAIQMYAKVGRGRWWPVVALPFLPWALICVGFSCNHG
jgi:hypothetical protein